VDTTTSATAIARRDPARALWAVAGACWVGTVVLVAVGGDALGHHDVVLERSTLPWVARISAFLGIWLVMIGAMMLPSVVPLVRLFIPVSARAPNAALARAAFFAGYLAVWMAFASVALAGDRGVHALVEGWAWLGARPELVLGTTLALAGAFQFSPLKNRCLTVCRNPAAFLWQHYRRGPSGGWLIGVRHGVSCLGCCWALMLVMFATGIGSLAWMVALTAVMVVEKTSRRGARLVAPVGVALIAGGAAVCLPALI